MIPSSTLPLTCTEDRLKSNTNLTSMLQNLSAKDSCIYKALKNGNKTDLGKYVDSFFSLVEGQDLDIAMGCLSRSYVARSWDINLESAKDGTNALYIKFHKEGKKKKPDIDYCVKLPSILNLSTIPRMGISDPQDFNHLRECTTYNDTGQHDCGESAENTSYSRIDLEPKHVYEVPDSHVTPLKHSNHLTLPIRSKNALASSCDTPTPNSNSSNSSNSRDLAISPCSPANQSPSHAPHTPLSSSSPYDKKEIAFQHRTETEKLQAERRKQALERSDSNHSNSDQSVPTHSYFSVLPRSKIPPKATYQQITEQNTPTIVHSLPSEKRLFNVPSSAHIEPRPYSLPTQFQQEDAYIEMNVLEDPKVYPHSALKPGDSQESKGSSHNSVRDSFGNSLMFSSKHDLSRTASGSQGEVPPPLPSRIPTHTDEQNVLPLPPKGQPASPYTGKKHASISTTKSNSESVSELSTLRPPKSSHKKNPSTPELNSPNAFDHHSVREHCGIHFSFNSGSSLHHKFISGTAYVLDKNRNVFIVNDDSTHTFVTPNNFARIANAYLHSHQPISQQVMSKPPKLPPKNDGTSSEGLKKIVIYINSRVKVSLTIDKRATESCVAKISEERKSDHKVYKYYTGRWFEPSEPDLWHYQSKSAGYFTYLNKFGNLFIRDEKSKLYYVYSNYQEGHVLEKPIEHKYIHLKQK